MDRQADARHVGRALEHAGQRERRGAERRAVRALEEEQLHLRLVRHTARQQRAEAAPRDETRTRGATRSATRRTRTVHALYVTEYATPI